eukprot:TRINITY_DN7445_c0_g1_i1.p1 TRINITY_DN7445_c0_g1~~TRINITY_DN7445_c0_g1_i1.p1  ORF type:complete len:641 (-),score=188.36 TRINITY_DN7445_c0_g1_i1:8-1930(-)
MEKKSSPVGKYGNEEFKSAFRIALNTKPPPTNKDLIDRSMFDQDFKSVLLLNPNGFSDKEKRGFIKEKTSMEIVSQSNKIQESMDLEETNTETEDIKLKNLPKEEWEAIAMKKHPNILALKERIRSINKYTTYGRNKNCAKTENVRILSPKAILQLIANHLYMIDKRETISVLEEEAGLNFIVDYDGFREESRLMTLLKLAKRRMPKGSKIFDQDLLTKFNPFQPHEKEVGSHLFDRVIENTEDVNIWQEPNTFDNVYIKQNNLQATNINKFVLLLCSANVKVLKIFTPTFESFLSSNFLLEKLFQLYHGPPSTILDSIRLKVMTMLKYIVQRRPDLFPVNSRIRSVLTNWLEGPPTKDGFSKPVENIKRLLEQITKPKEVKSVSQDTFPEPKIPKNIFSTRLKTYHVDPEELARQLTLLYINIFNVMAPNELLGKAWTIQSNQTKAPNIKELIRLNLVLSNWVAYEIIIAEKKKARPTILTHFIKFGSALRKLNNFHGLVGVVKGLTGAPMKLLKTCLTEIPTQVKEEMEGLVKFCEVNSLKKASRNLSTPFIAPLDYILEEAEQLEDTTPNEIDGLNNIEKITNLYNLIEPVYNSIEVLHKYLFLPIDQILALFDSPEYRELTEEYLIEEANKSEQIK